jgi:hypothetical protein
MKKFLYGVAAVFAVFAVFALLALLSTLMTAKSAPQEAAGFALACALALVPYVLARAVDLISGEDGAALQRMADAAEKTARALQKEK